MQIFKANIKPIWAYMNSVGLTLNVLSDESIPELLRLGDPIFTQDEPIAKYLGLKPLEWHTYMNHIIKDILKQQTSIGIFDKNKQLCAFFLSFDITTKLNFQYPSIQFKQMQDFCKCLNKPYFQRDFKKGEGLYFGELGVASEYRGRKLAYLLLQEIGRIGLERGFKEAYGESTNYLSALVMQNTFTYTRITNVIKYKDYQDENGVNIFQNLEGQGQGVQGFFKVPG